MVIELRVVQFWSEIILVISNRTRAARSFDFEITRMISDQIALHSVQLPLLIHLARCVKFNPQFNPWIVLIGLRGTEFNRRINLLRGFGRFNLGLALIGFRTTGARQTEAPYLYKQAD